MALNTVTVTWTEKDIGQASLAGTVVFAPNTTLTDVADGIVIEPTPKAYPFVNSTGSSDPLVANDNSSISPTGTWYVITVVIPGVAPRVFDAFINFSNGASQTLASLTPIVPQPTMLSYLPLPSGGPPTAGEVPSAVGDGSQNSVWAPAGTGPGGGVTTVSVATANGFAGTVANPTTTPAITVKTGVTGLLKGNGTAVSAATAGTDYLTPAGAAFTGPVVISDVPSAPAANTLPVGAPGDSTANIGLQIVSSRPSDDVPAGTDGTGRILLYSNQRAHTNLFGETIRNFLMHYDAKAMTAWYGPDGLYDGSGNPVGSTWHPWTWAGSHYEADDDGSIHAHYEIEVPDSTGAMQGRFEILFGNQSTGVIGLDKTTISTNLADFHVLCHGLDHTGTYQEQMFRLTGAAGFEKAIQWNDDDIGDNAGRRWQLSATADAETGSNVGTNWTLGRYSDGGTLLDLPIQVTRSTGLVTLGNATAGISSPGPVAISDSLAAGGALTVANTHTAPTSPTVQIVSTTAADAAVGLDVSGDTVQRLAIDSNGKMAWSSGAATTDVNLQRSSAGVLTCNGSLRASAPLGSGAVAKFTNTTTAPTAPNVQILSQTAADAALGVDVSGDTVFRLVVDSNGKHSWGPGGSTAADTVLERSAAGVLRLTTGQLAMNSQKITGLANGSASSDAAAFGQIPTSLPPNGAAGGVLSGTYPNPGFATTPLPESGGTMTGWLAPAVATLTFVGSGTTLVNAASGNAFNLTLTASTTTLGAPSNPVDGQVIRFRITQGTGGSFTLAYNAVYDFGAASAPTLSTAATKVDVLAFEYVASISKWCYLGSGLGF